ncbi:ferrous iron transport protein B [Schleiferiaceae bacterium]|jgi:ferrous iron transport protein B|nr:ferrous iron transport protein B [Schleiferiaceae bacterium]MDA9151139.1 ferrous iron transport protein B [Schleiferiaceae bacterium]
MPDKKALRIALVGRPNTGKSSLFNRLTGMNQKVGNYPGVTMERTTGLSKWAPGVLAEVVDLPGVYSLHASSSDEEVVMNALLQESPEERIDRVIGLADGTNLKTCLFVFSQVLDLGLPAVLAVTMRDEMERRGMELKVDELAQTLGCAVVLVNTRSGEGLEELREAVLQAKPSSKLPFFQPGGLHLRWLAQVQEDQGLELPYRAWLLGLKTAGDSAQETSGPAPKRARTDEAIQRYRQVNQWLRAYFIADPVKDRRWTARLDRIVVHPLWGSVVLFGLLFILFQALFYGSEAPMNFIDDQLALLSSWVTEHVPLGFLAHLISKGLIPGIAGVLMFIPQIALLFAFISLLEESGYMARVVFIMDRFMRPFGLSGKSVVPMVSGTACAIPAIMSTRNMENSRERFLAIAVTPLITCSARLPVYALLIGLVIPNQSFFGMNVRGVVLLALYALGFIAALAGSALLNRMMPAKKTPAFLLEMPPYRVPQWRNVITAVWNRTKSFVSEAGKIILAISVVLWFLASFGPDRSPDFSQERSPLPIEESYIGYAGKAIEPVMAPLGFDWKISVAVVSSFVAREVFVGTMATLYSVDDEDSTTIRAQMAREVNPKTGAPFFTLAVGVSLLLFYAFAMQCMSTFAVVARETQSYRFAIVQFIALGLLAYGVAWMAYVLLR